VEDEDTENCTSALYTLKAQWNSNKENALKTIYHHQMK
jgi:hypothetical protein